MFESGVFRSMCGDSFKFTSGKDMYRKSREGIIVRVHKPTCKVKWLCLDQDYLTKIILFKLANKDYP